LETKFVFLLENKEKKTKQSKGVGDKIRRGKVEGRSSIRNLQTLRHCHLNLEEEESLN